MARLGRPGDFYDQDDERRPPEAPAGRRLGRPGRLFDQDAPPSQQTAERRSTRRSRASEHQRALEARMAHLERFRSPRQTANPTTTAPLVITSRPGALQPPRPLAQTRIRGNPLLRATSTERATAILAVGTFGSRLTGFARVLVVGYVLGVSSLSDSFNYANGIPNIIYDLVVGGVLSATLIPVFVDHLRAEDRDQRVRAVSAVLSAVVATLVAVSALLWLFAPWVIRFYLVLSPGSIGPAERVLATRFLHFFAPQVFFLGAIVVTTALLNARRRFAAAAFSPILNNLIAIAALLVTKSVAAHVLSHAPASASSTLVRFDRDERAVWILGVGTTLGYAVQLLAQIPAMRMARIHVRWVWDLRHPAVRQVARLSSWLVGVVVANQLSLALVMVLAARVRGGVTAYQFSYQFFQLPYALVAVSVASALMPDLAERWSTGDRQGFERRFVTGLRVTLALLVPAGLVYVAVAQPFVQLAIHHGAVTGSGAHLVGATLAVFAAGLPGFSAFFLLMRLYQAMQDTRTMFWVYALENGLTLAAAPVLDIAFGVPGLALAWVGPYTVASLVAAVDLRRKVGPLGGRSTVGSLVRICVAAAATAAAVSAIGLAFPSHGSDPEIVARLVAQLAVGAGLYVVLLRAGRNLAVVTR